MRATAALLLLATTSAFAFAPQSPTRSLPRSRLVVRAQADAAAAAAANPLVAAGLATIQFTKVWGQQLRAFLGFVPAKRLDDCASPPPYRRRVTPLKDNLDAGLDPPASLAALEVYVEAAQGGGPEAEDVAKGGRLVYGVMVRRGGGVAGTERY